MTQYQLFDALTPDEYAALKASIRANGVLVPIEMDEQHHILDGHHRLQAWRELRAEGFDIPDYPTVTREGMTEAAKRAHIMTLNMDRRHLSKEARAAWFADMRADGMTLQAIADTVGMTKQGVHKALGQLSTRLTTERVTGRDGKSYPAVRPHTASSVGYADDIDEALEYQPSFDEYPSREIDEDTGEITYAADMDEDESPPPENNGRQKPKTNRTSDEDSPPFDRCQTPRYALDALLPFLSAEWLIWESAAGEGLLAGALMEKDLSVITSDVLPSDECAADVCDHDFLTDDPLENADVQVTNPPYSRKYDWLARSYQLGIPFALLLPVETLGAKTAQALFREHGVEVVLMDSRVNFKMPNIGWNGSAAQFPVAWFTWGLNIGQQLTFAHIEVRPDDR